ncbi:GATOR complex protein WDR24-like isoform X1 [Asterias rubens]|uniref:GATOR complex protein WDR24-like isoform X1 n=2 Tax=Asterias rubens TaxID=7604 RepID=UPI0014553E70|nr:GATOR complex protein WDR24-like isoform X1 [Asterias rubens]
MSRSVTDGVRSIMGHMTMGVKVDESINKPCINAISACADTSQIVVAGRSVFKIFGVEETCFKEKLDLRVGRITLKYCCTDVMWHPSKDNILATGATNGHVCTWDLNKHQGNKLDQEFTDHARTVNRVCFHPSEWYILLSGSQDGTMKFFDLRTNKCESTFGKQNESIRDIQFRPHSNYFTFAATADSGNLQMWDFRWSDKVLLDYMAHNGPAFSLDWHPEDRNLIATCGRDRLIKIWRLQDNAENKLTEEGTVYCIASVARIKWRPEKKSHIASCSQVVDQAVCVWDIRRPYMPFAVFEEHKDMATGVVWRDPHCFVSGGKDGYLYQHIFKDAKRPADSVCPVGVSLNIYGDVCHALMGNSSQTDSQMLATNYSSTRNPMTFRRRGPAGLPEVFRPYQSSMLVYNKKDTNAFSDVFVATAHRYKLTGKPFAELCEHNANVSRELGRHQVAQTWNMLKLIYTDNPIAKKGYSKSGSTTSDSLKQTEAEKASSHDIHATAPQPTDNPTVESTSGQTDDDSALSDSELEPGHRAAAEPLNWPQDGGAGVTDFFYGDQVREEGEGDADEMFEYENGGLNVDTFTIPNEAFSQRHEILDTYRPPSPDQSHYKPRKESISAELLDTEPDPVGLGNQILVAPAINPSVAKQLPFLQLSVKFVPIVTDMLSFYANQGDVQMAVSALIVLGDRIQDKISMELQEQWYMSYIDLLTYFKLWCVANEVTKLSNHTTVGSINQQSTTVYTKCNSCSGQLDKCSWACQNSKCRKLTNTCSVCHLPVKGLYVWCQGCSHGGHIQHIQEWLRENSTCPTGCGHYCEYT